MKKCSACAEEIQDDALKCRFCGEILVDDQWRSYCQWYARLPERQRQRELANMTEEQKQSFGAAWRLLGPLLGDSKSSPAAPAIATPSVTAHARSDGSQDKKTTTPKMIAVGCLGFIILLTAASIINSLSTGARSSPQVANTAPPSAEERTAEAKMLYERGKAALDREDYQQAEDLLSKVRRIQPDYMDLEELLSHPEIKKIAQQRRKERELSRLPSVYAKSAINVRGGPGTRNPIIRKAAAGERLRYEAKEGEWYRLGTSDDQPEWVHESTVLTESEKRIRDSADLQLLTWSWSTEYGFATAEGQVRNVSGRSLENVLAVVEWSTPSGTFITSADCLVQYNPILPGQTSPFRCSTTANPAMETASVSFQTLFGGRLVTYKE